MKVGERVAIFGFSFYYKGFMVFAGDQGPSLRWLVVGAGDKVVAMVDHNKQPCETAYEATQAAIKWVDENGSKP